MTTLSKWEQRQLMERPELVELDRLENTLQTNIEILLRIDELLEYQAATLVGMDPAAWSRKRKGRVSWTLRDLCKVALAFNCSPVDLLTEGWGQHRLEHGETFPEVPVPLAGPDAMDRPTMNDDGEWLQYDD